MALIPGKVLLINDEVVISVQLPEATIQHVKVLIREELANLVDVVLIGNLMQDVEQRRIFEVSKCDLAVIIHIEHKEDPHDHCL